MDAKQRVVQVAEERFFLAKTCRACRHSADAHWGLAEERSFLGVGGAEFRLEPEVGLDCCCPLMTPGAAESAHGQGAEGSLGSAGVENRSWSMPMTRRFDNANRSMSKDRRVHC